MLIQVPEKNRTSLSILKDRVVKLESLLLVVSSFRFLKFIYKGLFFCNTYSLTVLLSLDSKVFPFV